MPVGIRPSPSPSARVAIPPPEDLIQKLDEADVNMDGGNTMDELKTALKYLGAIKTMDELKTLLKYMGSIFPGWRAKRCFLKADSDRDGQISGKEIGTLVDYLISHGYGNSKS